MQKEMIEIKRFDFFALRDFAEPIQPRLSAPESMSAPALPEPEAPPPPPTFSEAEMEQAKQSAYKKGLEEGKATALTAAQQEEMQNQARLERQMQVLDVRLQEAQTVVAAHMQEQQETLAKLAFSVARKIAAESLQQNAFPVLQATIARCLPHILHEPAIKITINPQDANEFWSNIQAMIAASGYAGDVQMEEDASLQRADIRLEWRFGEAERAIEEIMAEIDALCPPFSVTPARPALYKSEKESLKKNIP
jgi:flagellar assembly protein FliH